MTKKEQEKKVSLYLCSAEIEMVQLGASLMREFVPRLMWRSVLESYRGGRWNFYINEETDEISIKDNLPKFEYNIPYQQTGTYLGNTGTYVNPLSQMTSGNLYGQNISL